MQKLNDIFVYARAVLKLSAITLSDIGYHFDPQAPHRGRVLYRGLVHYMGPYRISLTKRDPFTYTGDDDGPSVA